MIDFLQCYDTAEVGKSRQYYLDNHVNAIMSKAAKQHWFLKKLKRAGVTGEDRAYFYQAVVRPILEYDRPVSHTSLTKE